MRRPLEFVLAGFSPVSAAFEKAQAIPAPNLALYNGINAATMRFALHGRDYTDLAQEVLAICQTKDKLDDWTDVTCTEAHLLHQYEESAHLYEAAKCRVPEPRHWRSTGQQALDVLQRQWTPPESSPVAALFSNSRLDYQASREGSQGSTQDVPEEVTYESPALLCPDALWEKA